jgi:hypothetical protein
MGFKKPISLLEAKLAEKAKLHPLSLLSRLKQHKRREKYTNIYILKLERGNIIKGPKLNLAME